MNYIYKIVNNINHKIYIGKTRYTPLVRWNQHVCAANGDKNKKDYNFALHKAIRKYGQSNFTIEILEEIEDEQLLDERENYWIKYYNSCILNDGWGYNMTWGGEGSPKIDKDKVYEYWKIGYGSSKISELMNINFQVCKRILHTFQDFNEEINYARNKGTVVYQFDEQGNFVSEYPSITQAAKVVGVDRSVISKCCSKQKKSCKGYFWSYNKEEKFEPKKLKTYNKYYVAQLTHEGDIINVFNSLKSAASAMGLVQTRCIKECCDQKREEMYGFRWKYITKEEYNIYVDKLAVAQTK